ncbi:ras-like protein family member 11B [Schistocerca piceifrons]|uniref:ras-like protein family member 11B n=1 Tax=Schistocerca piceifrons TaxID=274613 RepID=UPI001F5FD6C4|nr:ras-like protein family member 11B [Schistocerca piceifrons]XP_049854672.1 ras-like protein family member 11B [Schistocerca gregaria]XP_049948321.1 ras-like protein family member 11B [Schistocerca serialis cubense]
MKTEDRNNNAPCIRIAVLGDVGVGKSALTVRFLTRRFIGEYRSDTDLLYRQSIVINNILFDVEVVDITGETRDRRLPVEQVEWSDACVLVYSITDRRSFNYSQQVLQQLTQAARPTALLANKADLEHLRQVQQEEGRRAAARAGCAFYEVSVAEDSGDLYAAFESLLREIRLAQPKAARKFSVSKMLGTLKAGRAASAANVNSVSCVPAGAGGSVVVCRGADLHHRRRVLRRRQTFSATASL